MTILTTSQSGGESNDIDMEAPSGLIASSTVTVDTTAAYINSGTNCLKFPLNSSASKAIIDAGGGGFGTNPVIIASGWVGASGTFSSEAGLLSDQVQGGDRYIRIGTDMKLRLYDGAGVQYGHATLSTVPTSAKTRFEVVWDYGVSATINQKMAWVRVSLGGYWQWEGLCCSANNLFDTNTLAWGEYLPAATNRGADLFCDDLTMRAVTLLIGGSRAGDHPAHKALPLIKIVGGAYLPPMCDASQTAWILTEGGGATGGFADWDDFPNNGATDAVGTGTVDFKETSRYFAANPVSSGDTIHAVFARDVSRLIAGGKLSFNHLYRDASGNEATDTRSEPGSTSYSGVRAQFLNAPSGSAWAYTDFDYFTGTSTATGATTMTDTGAVGWGTNTFAGAALTCGTSTATITTNTSTVLTHGGWTGGTPGGTSAYTIAASKLEFGGKAQSAGTISFYTTAMAGPEIAYSNANSIFSRGQYS